MAATVANDLTLQDVNPTGKEIGRGAYGRVFEVDYQGTLCAAKEVHALLLQYSDSQELSKITTDFLNECQIWSTIRHPCIVQFLGVYYPVRDQYKLPVMVMEKMIYSLRGLVEKYASIPLNVKLSILDEVCLGLRYLHSRNPPIVHRDLTPNNILLGNRLEAKITDLGVAKMMQSDSKKTMTKIPGTPDFMPPEALTKRPVYGPPLDIFSYGGVVLNVITHQWPEPSDREQLNVDTGRFEVISEVARRQHYLDTLTGGAADLKSVVTSCLDDDARNRPTVMQVSTEIKRIKDVCSQQTSHDGMSPIVWWVEVSGQSSSQQESLFTTKLEEMEISNKKLKGEVTILKSEISDLKVENDGLKVKIDGLTVDNTGLKAEITELKEEVDQLETKSQNLQQKLLMTDQIGSESPPVPPRSKRAVQTKKELEEVKSSNDKLKKEVDVLKTKIGGLKVQNDSLQEENTQLKDENQHLKEQLDCKKSPDPFSGQVNIKWQEGAPAPMPYANHSAMLLEGKVYIGGGNEAIGTPSYRIVVYDPADNSWSATPITTPYCNFAMAILNNRLIIAGGQDKSHKVTNKIFSVDGDELKKYTKMITSRGWATAAGHHGTLIITGGEADHHKRLASTELFDSSTAQWYATDNLPLLHCRLQAVVLDNNLYLLGGIDQGNNYSPTVFTAPLDTLPSHVLKWDFYQDTPWCRSAAVSVQDRYLLAVGGISKTGDRFTRTGDIHMFNKVSQSWKAIGKIPSERYTTAAVCIDDNTIMVFGGMHDTMDCTNTVWIGSFESQ
ncbi:probable serine/threonine-protein kinase drkD isoform X2 [Dysidea avara]|uniref:probable serine/threonine-protein kinase drkD isoform X2 n=1 Tax=Dysidea avara TaxID=196820 RepID=UPI00331B1DA7